MKPLAQLLLALVLAAPTAAVDAGICPADKSGANWLRHYTDACETLREAAADCSLCHLPDLEKNAYGLDLVPVGNLPWLIEDEDSDRDGRTNGEEIADCTLPGERDSASPAAHPTWSLLKRLWR